MTILFTFSGGLVELFCPDTVCPIRRKKCRKRKSVSSNEGHFTTQNSVRDFPDFGNPKKNWPGFRDFVQIWQRFPDFRKFLSRISGFPGISKTFKSTKFHLAFFLVFSPHRGRCAAKIPEVWGCDTPPQQIN